MKNSLSYSILGCSVIAILIALVVFCANAGGEPVFNTDLTQAKEALKHAQDVCKWMAAIQMAMIAAIATLLSTGHKPLTNISILPSLFFLAISLFCSAWALTGIPSITLRIADCDYNSVTYDVLTYTIYADLPEYINLGNLIGLQHWYWAVSLIFFISIIISPEPANTSA